MSRAKLTVYIRLQRAEPVHVALAPLPAIDIVPKLPSKPAAAAAATTSSGWLVVQYGPAAEPDVAERGALPKGATTGGGEVVGTLETRRAAQHPAPWTAEEEQALMTGLDMVKGPHWSQILQLFGPSGSISDILKDRSQVAAEGQGQKPQALLPQDGVGNALLPAARDGRAQNTRADAGSEEGGGREGPDSTPRKSRRACRGIMTLAGGLHNNARAAAHPAPAPPVALPRVQQPPQTMAASNYSGKPPMIAAAPAARTGLPAVYAAQRPVHQVAGSTPPVPVAASRVTVKLESSPPPPPPPPLPSYTHGHPHAHPPQPQLPIQQSHTAMAAKRPRRSCRQSPALKRR